MPNPPLRRTIHTGLAILLALLITRPALAHVSARTHLLVKLPPRLWAKPSSTLSAYAFEQWTPTLVPGWVRGTLPQAQVARSISEMARDPNVIAVQEDHRVQAMIVPDDTYWEQQWGPQKVRAPAAWDITTGDSGTIVAVLDTGVELTHSDLSGQFWVNDREVPGNGLDDDGNGHIDDIHGWRFGHDTLGNPIESNEINDDHGHGTHVAGIIAARGNNGQGIAGMAWDSRIMVVKVLDQKGEGYFSEIANGLIYATNNGARIANLSLGGPEMSSIMGDAIAYAKAHGTLVIAAAGNAGSQVFYPAAYPDAIAVAATDQNDQRLWFSCYGPEVDLSAPGSFIYSTCLGDSYCSKSGTSMATPHVAGLAALLWSQHPDYTPDQVMQRLRSTAQDINAPGWDEYTGWGRIDAQNALWVTQTSHPRYMPIVVLGKSPLDP
jgi:subtilisin family serine protease